MSRSRGILLAVVAAVAVLQGWALRATWHPAPHPGGDNAGYVALADALAEGRGYTETWDPARPPHTKYPPVFPALLALALGVGATTWAGLKVVPLLCSVLAVAAVFLWGSARRGPAWGGAVALLTGWSATLLYHAHYLLSDVPFLAFTLGALWLLEERRVPEEPGGAATARRIGGPAAVLALMLAGAAYFTRSAGLPLVVAVLAALAVARHRRLAAAGAVLLAGPAVLWLLRGRGAAGEGAYVREFWLVDPYRPDLGEIGPLGLIPRAWQNAGDYLVAHLPAALAGPGEGATVLGVLVGLAALVGWSRAVTRRVGAAELFAPLYAAVVLVWPVVWSGDRFALPLVPLAVLYAGEALEWGVGRARRSAVAPALAAGAVALLLAQGAGVARAADESAACRGAVRAGGPWACSGIGMVQFAEAARWAGANLPPEATVLTRKPRIWYAMSGRATRTYPFLADPDSLLATARRAGASYVLLDLVAGQARLLAAAIGARPGAFCSVAGFGGRDGQPRTELLGILPDGPAGGASGDEVRLGVCPDAMRGAGVGLEPYTSASSIPILVSPSEP